MPRLNVSEEPFYSTLCFILSILLTAPSCSKKKQPNKTLRQAATKTNFKKGSSVVLVFVELITIASISLFE